MILNTTTKKEHNFSNQTFECDSADLRRDTQTFVNLSSQSTRSDLFILGTAHFASSPDHRPVDRHTRTEDPSSRYPLLQENRTRSPSTYQVPTFLPFCGGGRKPQDTTAYNDRADNMVNFMKRFQNCQPLHTTMILESLAFFQVLHERHMTLESQFGGIAQRWAAAHQDIIPTKSQREAIRNREKK